MASRTMLTEAQWSNEVKEISQLIDSAVETNKNRLAFQSKGSDASAYLRHLKRQLTSIKKRLGEMGNVLRQFERDGIIGEDQQRSRRITFERLGTEYDYVNEQLNILPEESFSYSGSFGGASAPSPILSKTQTPSYLPEDLSDLLRHQNLKMKEQDAQIVGIETSASKTKQLALAIHHEICEQNLILDQMNDEADRLQSKVKVGEQRLKKI